MEEALPLTTPGRGSSEIVQAETDYDRGEPKALLIAGLGISGIVLLLLIMLGVQMYFDRIREAATYRKVLVPVSDDLKSLRSQEDEELNNYKYLDRKAGVVQVPVSRSMQLLAEEAAAGKISYFHKATPLKPVSGPAPGAADGSPGTAAVPNASAKTPSAMSSTGNK